MRIKVNYEWCREVMDGEDIVDNHFEDQLVDLIDSEGVLVLVRNEGNENEGVTDRFWAYVVNGKLPDCFSDAMGNELPGLPVPLRFHKELSKQLITNE